MSDARPKRLSDYPMQDDGKRFHTRNEPGGRVYVSGADGVTLAIIPDDEMAPLIVAAMEAAAIFRDFDDFVDAFG